MSDFAIAWTLSRQRFVDTISDLNAAQLNWKLHSEALSIAQMALHVAGVEVFFLSQLTGQALNADETKIKDSAVNGVVNEKPFPFTEAELTPQFVLASLEHSKGFVKPIIESPTPEILKKEIISALGPIITGEAGFARLAFHSAYHQGPAYLIRTAPGFPA